MVAIETASLLNRAGFEVDLVTNNPISKKLRSVQKFIFIGDPGKIPQAALNQARAQNYDLIVILDDYALQEIMHSNLSDHEKLILLPVSNKDKYRHIGSKCGLSLVLAANKIRTPDFIIANKLSELNNNICKLGGPSLIKVDFSGAGNGIFECNSKKELKNINNKIISWPVLLQRKIRGIEIDLSAFYQDCKLIHFSYSLIEGRVGGKFSPSALRTYTQLAKVERDVFDDLRRLGIALGANGFANISCIKSEVDGQLYFIEADMRPNVWVNYPRYFGDDPAIRISKYFSDGEVINYPYSVHSKFPDQILLPYFSRLKLRELIINKYNSWSYIPHVHIHITLLALLNKAIKNLARRFLKPMFPVGLWLKLKRGYERGLRNLMR